MSAERTAEEQRPVLLDDPIKAPGIYTLDLYCKYKHPPVDRVNGYHMFGALGQTRREAIADARRAGWTLHADQTATCPRCKRALSRQLRTMEAERGER